MISDLDVKVVYDTAGDTVLAINFDHKDNNTVKVYHYSSAGVETELTTLDFTPTLTLGYWSSITLNTAIGAGEKVAIVRVSPYIQGRDPLDPIAENALDDLVRLAQELDERIKRCLQANASISVTPVLPAPVANYYLGWNSAGTALENKAAPADLAQIQADVLALQVALAALKAGSTKTIQDLDDQDANINADIADLIIEDASLQSQITALSNTLYRERLGTSFVTNNSVGIITGLVINDAAAESTRIQYEVNRKTDDKSILTTGFLVMHQVSAHHWIIERESTVNISGVIADNGTADGIVFGVVDNVPNPGECQVTYSADDMAGANYAGTVSFLIQDMRKIP